MTTTHEGGILEVFRDFDTEAEDFQYEGDNSDEPRSLASYEVKELGLWGVDQDLVGLRRSLANSWN